MNATWNAPERVLAVRTVQVEAQLVLLGRDDDDRGIACRLEQKSDGQGNHPEQGEKRQ
ncbi:MAG: hypothetical protein HZA52_05895 [Planctomycetes bacterium]|nr:hypothetical protein [Planctomycetota bacterium]